MAPVQVPCRSGTDVRLAGLLGSAAQPGVARSAAISSSAGKCVWLVASGFMCRCPREHGCEQTRFARGNVSIAYIRRARELAPRGIDQLDHVVIQRTRCRLQAGLPLTIFASYQSRRLARMMTRIMGSQEGQQHRLPQVARGTLRLA